MLSVGKIQVLDLIACSFLNLATYYTNTCEFGVLSSLASSTRCCSLCWRCPVQKPMPDRFFFYSKNVVKRFFLISFLAYKESKMTMTSSWISHTWPLYTICQVWDTCSISLKLALELLKQMLFKCWVSMWFPHLTLWCTRIQMLCAKTFPLVYSM